MLHSIDSELVLHLSTIGQAGVEARRGLIPAATLPDDTPTLDYAENEITRQLLERGR
jgi:hypothetical protein